MQTGWTGGQYSVYRAILGIEIAGLLVGRIASLELSAGTNAILGVALLACAALAIGWQDRRAAFLLLVLLTGVVAFIDGAPLVLPGADLILTSALLLLHLPVTSAPFGAWQARGRTDPAGGWQLRPWIHHLVWILLAGIHLATALARVSGSAFRPTPIDPSAMAAVGFVFALGLAVAVVRARWRAPAWIAMTLFQVAWLAAFGPALVDSNLWLLQLLAFDPAWLPGRSRHPSSPEDPARLFFDGDCGLCHRSVRFILAEEAGTPPELRPRFAPLGGPSFERFVEASPKLARESLPDSLMLAVERDELLMRSAAVIEIASRLGGLWRALAWLGGLLPTRGLDLVYDGIARVRKRVFAQPAEACPILPPELRTRFDA